MSARCGDTGSYSTLRDVLRDVLPAGAQCVLKGHQGQVNFDHSSCASPTSLMWFRSFGCFRWYWAIRDRFACRQTADGPCVSQGCVGGHRGVPREILYDGMKNAVIGEEEKDISAKAASASRPCA